MCKVDSAVLDRHFLNAKNAMGKTKDIKIFKMKEIRQTFFLSNPLSCLRDGLCAVIITINAPD